VRKLTEIALIVVMPLGLVVASVPEAGAAGETKIGYLGCNVASGGYIIFGSSRELDCTYTPVGGKPVEHYKGEINKFGGDIGYLQSGVILWTVVAPSTNTGEGALAGHYAGATASIGAGANVLVDGMHSSIALQPISVEGNAGLNVAAGVATINLDYVFPPK
jgi:hypothetical protein